LAPVLPAWREPPGVAAEGGPGPSSGPASPFAVLDDRARLLAARSARSLSICIAKVMKLCQMSAG